LNAARFELFEPVADALPALDDELIDDELLVEPHAAPPTATTVAMSSIWSQLLNILGTILLLICGCATPAHELRHVMDEHDNLSEITPASEPRQARFRSLLSPPTRCYLLRLCTGQAFRLDAPPDQVREVSRPNVSRTPTDLTDTDALHAV
jgi:hypothetical protein